MYLPHPLPGPRRLLLCVCVCVWRRRSPPGILQHSQAFPGLGVLFNLESCIFINQEPVVPLTSTFTGSLPTPRRHPRFPSHWSHPDPAAVVAAGMACKRIFLITGTISSPRLSPFPSLLSPPPSSSPSLSSPPPSSLSPCLPSTLTHAGREKRRLSNFSHLPQMLSKVISGRAETTDH